MPDPEGWVEVTIPLRELVSRLVWWLVAVAALVYIPSLILSGFPALPTWPWPAGWLHDVAVGAGILLLAYLISVPIHEGLHVAGMMITGTRWSEITFGARILQGVVYVHCGTPMELSAYRTVLLLPVAVTGVAPAIFGIISGNMWVTTYAYLMIVSAIGDLEIFWRLRSWPGDTVVRDHPSQLGCQIREDGGVVESGLSEGSSGITGG
jgi:hypothetical protein